MEPTSEDLKSTQVASVTVLVLAPHPDDEAIGCGGSILLHQARGDRVTAVFLTSGEKGLQNLPPAEAWKIREREAKKSAKILGLKEIFFLRQPDWQLAEKVQPTAAALQPILRQQAPQIIYLPHPGEWHPDHQASWTILKCALNGDGMTIPEIRAYEVWTPLSHFDHIEDISLVMTGKIRALRCHRSQFGEFDYSRAVKGLNQYRGALAGKCAFAEAFEILKP
jgi:N-acetylglucosamine malate deacetylase 1